MIDPASYYASTDLLDACFIRGDARAMLSPIESKLVWKLRLKAIDVKAAPRAIVVGEMPSARSSPWCPLFPYPKLGSGGRLAQLAGQTPVEFLSSWFRFDLVPVYRAVWTQGEAERAAVAFRARYTALAWALEADGKERPRIVTIGVRAAAAFGGEAFEQWMIPLDDGTSAEVCGIGHPSGANPAYRFPQARAEARRLLRWALRS